ncbi:MAG: hypothetical protein JXR48_08125, partial [Candidatus Delongbacteria bacterium]|nr:hypothetical protein [Candidatus Delongbacteria bacterium]MBN2834920.1 hypothetical protein [Candidatus Delongbacteria bacterium]
MKKELIVFLFVLAAIAQSTLWTVSELPAPAYNWRGAMKMSPDKKYLASYNYNRVLLYDIVTQNEIIVHTFRMSYDRNPTLSWSYDSRSIMFPDLVNEQNEPDSSAVIQYSIETGLKDTILTNNGYHAYFSPVDNKILYNMGIG